MSCTPDGMSLADERRMQGDHDDEERDDFDAAEIDADRDDSWADE